MAEEILECDECAQDISEEEYEDNNGLCDACLKEEEACQ